MILHLNSFISLAFVSTRYALFVSHRLVVGDMREVVPTFLSRLQLLRCFNKSNIFVFFCCRRNRWLMRHLVRTVDWFFTAIHYNINAIHGQVSFFLVIHELADVKCETA